ncbi:hypothetical protein OB920_03725 [Halobacteria archaeon HArc-gm2]|nr:hypothetical protein [Halobacteria archaeon HArc-gm2]
MRFENVSPCTHSPFLFLRRDPAEFTPVVIQSPPTALADIFVSVAVLGNLPTVLTELVEKWDDVGAQPLTVILRWDGDKSAKATLVVPGECFNPGLVIDRLMVVVEPKTDRR